MKDVTVIGIDLAKAHFQLHGLDKNDDVVLRKTLKPLKVLEFLSNLKPCIVGMETCGGCHFYARKIKKMGHTVRLIPPQYVRPHVIGNHNDLRDAEAIAEVCQSKRIKFVPIRTAEQQDVQSLHRIRSRLIKNKTALTNQIHGLLYESGIIISRGAAKLRKAVSEILLEKDDRLSEGFLFELSELYEEFKTLLKRISQLDSKLEGLSKTNELSKILTTIPAIGPMVSTAVVGATGNIHSYKNGRQYAASLGLVPGHKHTGGPTKSVVMLGITKRGNNYLRKMLIQASRAWLIHIRKYKPTKRTKWALELYEKKGFNKTAVAIANKNARTIWALLTTMESYKESKAT